MTDVRRLEAALDRVHAALLAANFNELPKIVTETEGLLEGLRGLPSHLADTTTATRLRDKANRNSQCLQAAARGLRSAQRRIAEMAGSATALSTYTNRGQRAELGIGPTSLTQRL